MDYFKAFETIKSALEKADIKLIDGHFAIQVRLSDETASGIMYIETKDKQLFVEPYDYYDNDADILTSVKDLKSIIEGKLDIQKAIEDGKVSVSGYVDGLIAFFNSIPKKTKKTTVKKAVKKSDKPASKKATKTAPKTVGKKTTSAKSATKALKKETEAAKMSEEAKKPDTTAKETIAEVVEKEIKPKKKTK